MTILTSVLQVCFHLLCSPLKLKCPSAGGCPLCLQVIPQATLRLTATRMTSDTWRTKWMLEQTLSSRSCSSGQTPSSSFWMTAGPSASRVPSYLEFFPSRWLFSFSTSRNVGLCFRPETLESVFPFVLFVRGVLVAFSFEFDCFNYLGWFVLEQGSQQGLIWKSINSFSFKELSFRGPCCQSLQGLYPVMASSPAHYPFSPKSFSHSNFGQNHHNPVCRFKQMSHQSNQSNVLSIPTSLLWGFRRGR